MTDGIVTGKWVTSQDVLEGCQKCLDAGFPARGTCQYCDAPLSVRHEHDHFPIPARYGGDNTVPTCLNCHDLKDRVSLENWPEAEYMAAIQGAPPSVRILYAKTLATVADVLAERDALERVVGELKANELLGAELDRAMEEAKR